MLSLYCQEYNYFHEIHICLKKAKRLVRHVNMLNIYLFLVTDRFIIYLMVIHAWLDIGLVDRGELNFDQFFLQFNVKKKIYA